jgi:hypothetical protein
MALSIYAGLFGIALATVSGYQLASDLRDGRVRTNRLTRQRHVNRSRQPALYWTNIVATSVVVALGLIVTGLAFLPPSGFP